MNKLQDTVWKDQNFKLKSELSSQERMALPERIDLSRIHWIRPLLLSRWPQLVVRALLLAGFVFTITAGLIGTRVGSHNFAIIFVWITWWTALKLAFIPLGGRSWCSVCPIPLPGEWLQQGGIFEKRRKQSGLNLRWPKRLRGSWLQSSGFLLIGLFSAVTLTDARLTAWILLGLFGLATVLSLVFERRAFCSYICPVGGFSGIYAKTAPVEVRVVEPGICANHREKTCYHNCPWGLYPVALRDSSQCGLCMECLRSCPSDNIAVNLRPFGTDLTAKQRGFRPSSRLDEAFLALVMLGSALAFSAVFSGPWGSLRMAAFEVGSRSWLLYATGYLAFTLVVVPGAFSLAAWTGLKWSGSKSKVMKTVADQSAALLPLGLCAWIAFTVSFAFPKLNYVFSVVSDPLGWGWNLFGSAGTTWTAGGSGFGQVLQVAVLLVGLCWSASVAHHLAKENTGPNLRRLLPILAFCLVFSLAMLWLLIG